MSVPYIQEWISQLSELIGVDVSNLKILICALLSFPFSGIYKRLPDHKYTLKNVYIIAVSAFYLFVILEVYSGFRTLFTSALASYFITRYVRTSSMPWINFIFLMSHLSYNHIHAQFYSDYNSMKVDITGAQMVMVMKLSAFGWNVHDARNPRQDLSSYAKSKAIMKHPGLLPFLGYVFFYASVLTGPAFDYADYDKFIHSTLFDDVPSPRRPGNGKRRIPRSGRVALKKTLSGFFWAFLFVNSSKFVSLDYVLNGDFVKEHSFISRIFYLWALGLSYRLKYYTIWQIAEGSCILSGISYNGYDKESNGFKWNRVQNIDPLAFETGQNVHICLESWNMNTNKWLKNYVYFRIAKKGKKPGFKSTVFTFATSACWHGYKPGYYLTFITGAFIQTIGKIFRRNIRPIFLLADGVTPKNTKIVYDTASYFVTQLTFGFIVQPFVILNFKESLYCWSTCYFYVHIGIAVTFLIFSGPYSKQVKGYLKSLTDAGKKSVANSRDDTVDSQGREKMETAVKKALEKEDYYPPSLGVPSIDVLENLDKKDLDNELREMNMAWSSFKERRSSIKEDDFEGLKSAYNNFTEEMNDLFRTKKEELILEKKDD